METETPGSLSNLGYTYGQTNCLALKSAWRLWAASSKRYDLRLCPDELSPCVSIHGVSKEPKAHPRTDDRAASRQLESLRQEWNLAQDVLLEGGPCTLLLASAYLADAFVPVPSSSMHQPKTNGRGWKQCKFSEHSRTQDYLPSSPEAVQCHRESCDIWPLPIHSCVNMVSIHGGHSSCCRTLGHGLSPMVRTLMGPLSSFPTLECETGKALGSAADDVR